MPGFLAIVCRDERFKGLNIDFHCARALVARETAGPGFQVHQHLLPKFPNDSILYETEECLVVFGQVLMDSAKFVQRHKCESLGPALWAAYCEEGSSFLRSLRGEFSGAILDKRRQVWVFFTNHLGTQPVYYYAEGGVFVVGSELKWVTAAMKQYGVRPRLDEGAAYELLTYGHMLGNRTVVSGARRLTAGHALQVEGGNPTTEAYYRLTTEPELAAGKEEIVDTLGDLFDQALHREYGKDREYGFRHIASLSGGLDSRLGLFRAQELGYEPITALTFAESTSADFRIARRIASARGLNWMFRALDGGSFLVSGVTDAVLANDGLVFWLGAAHSMATLDLLDWERHGLLHSGQLGDAVMGSFVKSEAEQKPDPAAMERLSLRFWNRIASDAYQTARRYETQELFLWYNRAFNAVVNGNVAAARYTTVCSPFCDTDFMEFALRIPRKWRYSWGIYKEFLKGYCPSTTGFVWGKTGLRPCAGKSWVRVAGPLVRRARRILGRMIPELGWELMNPSDVWYKQNPAIGAAFSRHFAENRQRLESWRDLSKDCAVMFEQGDIVEKSLVMTLIEGMRVCQIEE